MLTATKPKCFADLVRISGLSHGTDVWANNARDLIRNGIATLEQVIATREDIFLYLMKSGLDPASAFGIAEKVRKGRPLSDTDTEQMKQFSSPRLVHRVLQEDKLLVSQSSRCCLCHQLFPDCLFQGTSSFGVLLDLLLVYRQCAYHRLHVPRTKRMEEVHRPSRLQPGIDCKGTRYCDCAGSGV